MRNPLPQTMLGLNGWMNAESCVAAAHPALDNKTLQPASGRISTQRMSQMQHARCSAAHAWQLCPASHRHSETATCLPEYHLQTFSCTLGTGTPDCVA